MVSNTRFCYVPELTDEFLKLWPHRHDYIWAKHPAPGKPPSWSTENRHPLSDRLIRQGSYLYGVRFGAETCYAMLDIDAGSIYHPNQDKFAIPRMIGALEQLGMVAQVAITSSYSGGIHLYFPFEQPQPTWRLAMAMAIALENAGFILEPGQLETFPNARLHGEGFTLYKAHRLPLQSGSYLLTDSWEMAHTTAAGFCRQWEWCMRKNDVHQTLIDKALKQGQRRQFKLSTRGQKFLNDLNAEIEPGWSGHGQTNYLLGRIALREYCFGHLAPGGNGVPLRGEMLIAKIVAIAVALPGYRDWCRHQQEIGKRAEEWARSVESSTRYFPYKFPKHQRREDAELGSSPADSWNAQQEQDARDRIRYHLADMLEAGTLPASATARFQSLKERGVGSSTLYRHRDLWHPVPLEPLSEPVENPPHPPMEIEQGGHTEKCPPDAPSLLPQTGGNILPGKVLTPLERLLLEETGGNTAPRKDSSDFKGGNHG